MLNSDGTIDLSSTISPYTFNTITGEFKIIAFSGTNPNSYFTGNYMVRLKSDYISGTVSLAKYT